MKSLLIAAALLITLSAHAQPATTASDPLAGSEKCFGLPESQMNECLADWAKQRFAPVSTLQPSPEIQAQRQCLAELSSRPAIAELVTTLGANQTTLTPVQMFNNAYASPKDSGAAQSMLEGLAACGVQPSVQALRIWRGFAAGAFTYSETSLLLKQMTGAHP